MIQKLENKVWKDETGQDVPVEYISLGTRLKERSSASLLKEAELINSKLMSFKKRMEKLCEDVYRKAMEEYKAKPDGKGNFTWFNFDRSIKIEVSISDRITFDDLAIQASKEKLDSFLSENLDSKMEFVKDLVIDAFSTTRGKIDAKKVFALMKYRTKISHPLFQEALNVLSDGLRHPGSKTYFRLWKREEDGSYKLIELNFSAL
ncbi:MAG: DUF3164 family protein [Bacteroidetes bacterium]|nr:DUF3164 family protein [Bacteroidota bacterium]